MSVDRSLRLKSSLVRHRNVLTRAERIATLRDADRWQDTTSPLGLPKVPHRKAKAGKKKAEPKQAATAAAGEEPKQAPA